MEGDLDVLADFFSLLRLESVLHGRLEATAPWGIQFQSDAMARFALIARGSCWLSIEGQSGPIALRSGDCILLLRPQTYTLSDAPDSPVRPYAEVHGGHVNRVAHCGGGGAASSIVIGRFRFDRFGGQPLIDLLPTLMHFRMDEMRSRSLQATLDLLSLETRESGLGAALITSRLADIVFLQAIRAYADSNAVPRRGWLAALSDGQLRKAIQAMHADVAHPWTVESLAALAGMSRSAFAAHFKEKVGEPPLSYLGRWRMHKAKYHLRRGDKTIAGIAAAIGYETEEAFGKAFRRAVGMTAGAYRRFNHHDE
jgi:AraC-like DNA-binding protein